MAGIFEKLPIEKLVSTSTLADRLRVLGDVKKVNPPSIETPSNPPPIEMPSTPASVEMSPTPPVEMSSSAVEMVTPEPILKKECPWCHRFYKHLSRHRNCPNNPTSESYKFVRTSEGFVTDTIMPLKATIASTSTSEATTEAPKPNVALQGICHPVVRVFNPLDQLRNIIENIGVRAEGCENEVINLLEHQAEVLRGKIHRQKDLNVGTLCNQGYILLLGAIPDGFDNVIKFEDLIEPLEHAVAAENKVCHWSVVDYGKGAGYLAAKLARLLVETPLQGMLVVSDCETASARACRDILIRGVKQVIYGL